MLIGLFTSELSFSQLLSFRSHTMKFPARLWLLLLLFVASAITVQAQTTLSDKTSNNTSACSDGSSHCQAGYAGMSDPTSGTYNAVPGNVSREDMNEMEYSGAN